ncbi:Hypothetical protein A7982_00082 [Minicystis rosea]|nr:Hypothetical protein A7982_00082 [Minicystis rosea]
MNMKLGARSVAETASEARRAGSSMVWDHGSAELSWLPVS